MVLKTESGKDPNLIFIFGLKIRNNALISLIQALNTIIHKINMGKFIVKAFGITRDIVGTREAVVEFDGNTVASLRAALKSKYPALLKVRSLMIAVNNTYAEDDLAIGESDEIALIPPVSGG